MYSFRDNPFLKKRLEMKLSYRKLQQRTKEFDPRKEGLSTTTIARAERGFDDISGRTLLILCNTLDVSPRTLFTNRKGK